MNFEPYPFEKLNTLLNGIKPNTDYAPAILTIGEPQFDTPPNIVQTLQDSSHLLNKYPKSSGEIYLKTSMINFIKRRFTIDISPQQIIPTFGTREVLFNLPGFLLFDKPDSTMAYTNPYYKIYEGASTATKSQVIHIDLKQENNFKPQLLSDEQFNRCDIVILNFPNNPTGAVITIDELSLWVAKALEFDFKLISDECYSEIYDDTKPPSVLQACKQIGNDSFKNCLALNSISKRNSAPGLRSGFVCGDENIIQPYGIYRTYVGCAIPLPLQAAQAVAWDDDLSAENFRQIYRQNMTIASEILDIEVVSATFYIWLKVADELEFTKNLYETKNIKVLPGSYLGKADTASQYVRIALVENPQKTKEILTRLKSYIQGQSKT